MKSFHVLAGLAGLLLAVSGCAGLGSSPCCQTTGWLFQVGKPSLLTTTTPTVLHQQTGPVGIAPMGAMGAISNAALQTTALPARSLAPCGNVYPESSTTPAEQQLAPPRAIPKNCTLQDVCDKLDKVLDKVGGRERD